MGQKEAEIYLLASFWAFCASFRALYLASPNNSFSLASLALVFSLVFTVFCSSLSEVSAFTVLFRAELSSTIVLNFCISSAVSPAVLNTSCRSASFLALAAAFSSLTLFFPVEPCLFFPGLGLRSKTGRLRIGWLIAVSFCAV